MIKRSYLPKKEKAQLAEIIKAAAKLGITMTHNEPVVTMEGRFQITFAITKDVLPVGADQTKERRSLTMRVSEIVSKYSAWSKGVSDTLIYRSTTAYKVLESTVVMTSSDKSKLVMRTGTPQILERCCTITMEKPKAREAALRREILSDTMSTITILSETVWEALKKGKEYPGDLVVKGVFKKVGVESNGHCNTYDNLLIYMRRFNDTINSNTHYSSRKGRALAAMETRGILK